MTKFYIVMGSGASFTSTSALPIGKAKGLLNEYADRFKEQGWVVRWEFDYGFEAIAEDGHSVNVYAQPAYSV